jgi:hypothetical protein
MTRLISTLAILSAWLPATLCASNADANSTSLVYSSTGFDEQTVWESRIQRGQSGNTTSPVRAITVFMPVGEARIMDFKASDVAYVPAMAGYYIENTGDTDLVVLEMFKAPRFEDVSLNNWLRHLPPEMVTSHLGIDSTQIESIPALKREFVGKP